MSSKIHEIPTIDLSSHPTPQKRMTFEEFLQWSDEDVIAEWVDGEVIVMSPAARRHQELIVFLVKTLGLYVDVHHAGVVLTAPFIMRMAEIKRGREPDLLFIKQERAHLIEKTYLNGPADIVIEIVSPESIGRDRGEKFVEYEKVGIKEYWLIDPDRESAEFYELDQQGRYRAATLPDGIYRSNVVPGFFVRLSWLWQTPLPTLEALRELKLI